VDRLDSHSPLDTLLRLKLRQVRGGRMLSARGGDIHLLSRCIDDSSDRLANIDVGNCWQTSIHSMRIQLTWGSKLQGCTEAERL